MSIGDLSDENWSQLQKSGEILSQVFDEVIDRIEPGASHLATAEYAETRMRDLGGDPAFPVNISIDEEAHAIPAADDDTIFGETDIVCLDMGTHVDGWCADAAVTIDLSGEQSDLVTASQAALDAALETIAAGVHTGEIGAVIEDTIRRHGFRPIVNLTGHGLAHYDAHTAPEIPNVGHDGGIELVVGDVLAVEPFATTGRGRVTESGVERIFSLAEDRPVRDRRARQLLVELRKTRRELPFTTRWYDISGLDVTVRRLVKQGILTAHPVLKEEAGALVSQAEQTVVVTEDGCEVTTPLSGAID